MEDKKEVYDKRIIDYIEKITTPIFAKTLDIPQEEVSNSMTTSKKPFKIFFRPNNWRRQIEVKEKTNSIINYLREVNPTININSHTKLISIKNYKPNITIQYGKNTLTAIYSCPIISSEKQGWEIERDTIQEVQARVDEIKEDIEKRLDNTLNEFSRKFKINLPFKKVIWSRHEDFIKGETYIDNLPRDCIIHDTIGKKVYGEGWEFIGGKGKEPTVYLKTYLKNRAVEDIAPEIAESLNQLNLRFDTIGNRIIDMMNVRVKVDKELAINIRTHNKVFKKLDKLLSQKPLLKWL